MAKEQISLSELAEFLNEVDDSDGHRLAQFLQKKSGYNRRKGQRIFADLASERFSLNVCVEKCSPLQNADSTRRTPLKNISSTMAPAASGKSLTPNPRPTAPSTLLGQRQTLSPLRAKELIEKARGITVDTTFPLQSSVAPAPAPHPALSEKFTETTKHADFSPNDALPLPMQELPVIRRAGGLRTVGSSPSDRLRRNSLKRLSILHGRRTLLTEFEKSGTFNEFEPLIHSTPMLYEKNEHPTNCALVSMNTSENHSQVMEKQVSSTSLLPEQPMMDPLPTKRHKVLKHSKALEKRKSPKPLPEDPHLSDQSQVPNEPQVPEQPPVPEEPQVPEEPLVPEEPQVLQAPKHYLQTPHRRSKIPLYCSKPKEPLRRMSQKSVEQHLEATLIGSASPPQQRSSVAVSGSVHGERSLTKQKENRSMSEATATPSFEWHVPVSPDINSENNETIGVLELSPQKNIPLQTTHVMVPETQDPLIAETEGASGSPVFLVPLTQTIQRGKTQSSHKRCSSVLSTVETVESSGDLIAETPLNLAAPKSTRNQRPYAYSLRSKRTECGPPGAHPLNLQLVDLAFERGSCRKNPALNKAPSTPINGEKYALELARMTNHEILDLRMRNSLGKLFPISGRKSQMQQKNLEEQIEMEIQTRFQMQQTRNDGAAESMIVDQPPNLNNRPNPSNAIVGNEDSPARCCDLDEIPTTSPREAAVAPTHDDLYVTSSLVDDHTFGRVNFVSQPKKGLRHRQRHNARDVAVQIYLDVSKKVKKRKDGIIYEQSTKRSLYTKGQSDTENSLEVATATSTKTQPGRAAKRSTDLPTILRSPVAHTSPRSSKSRSPLHQVSPVVRESSTPDSSSIRVSSPQSRGIATTSSMNSSKRQARAASSPTGRISNYTQRVLERRSPSFPKSVTANGSRIPVYSPLSPVAETARTPPQLLSQTPVSRNSAAGNKTKVSPLPTTTTDASIDNASTLPADDVVFKKPPVPASKRGRLGKPADNAKGKTALKETAPQEAESVTSTLRRSKRGQVARKTSWSHTRQSSTPFVQLLYESAMNKRKSKKGKSLCSSSIMSDNLHPIASSTANLYSAERTATKKTRVKRNGISKSTKKAENKLMKSSAASLLGDTNATASLADVTLTKRTNHLSAIHELPHEDVQVDEEHTQTKQQPKNDALRTLASSSVLFSEEEGKRTIHRSIRARGLERSRVVLTPAPVNQLNEIFDQLKNARGGIDGGSGESIGLEDDPQEQATAEPVSMRSDASTTAHSNSNGYHFQTRCCKVRLRRIKLPPTEKKTDEATQTKNVKEKLSNGRTPSDGANLELISWLKMMPDQQAGSGVVNLFNDMYCSFAGSLMFVDLEGIDYAFYRTEERGSLGYLRFKPRQFRSTKRAKNFDLHFVVLSGEFKIYTSAEQGSFRVADMVVIRKGSRYSIENITDEIALLMVIKK